MRRTLSWLVILPFAAASVLLGHAITYWALGLPADDLHGYLAHAPQVVFILATVGLIGLAVDSRARRHSPAPLASLAIVAFVTQEHLERLIHTGQFPFLLTTPVLWVGIALQLPVALLVWIVARRLAEDLAAPCRRANPRAADLASLVVAATELPVVSVLQGSHPGRGPPVLS